MPLLPPGSSWKPKKPTVRSKSLKSNLLGPKSVARTTREQQINPHNHGNKPTIVATGSGVSKIVAQLNLDEPQPHISRGSEIHVTPHSVPASFKEKQFLLPPRGSRGANIGGNEGGARREGAIVGGKGSTAVIEELKRGRDGGERVKAFVGAVEKEEEGERGREGEDGRNAVRESRSFSGSRRSTKIKSSWTCYLDGPADEVYITGSDSFCSLSCYAKSQ